MAENIIQIEGLLCDPARLAMASSLSEHPEHRHGLGNVIGYVVRQTRVDGRVLPADRPGRPGVDRWIIQGDSNYGAAVDAARAMRTAASYAVVDYVYSCGCRS